MTHVTVREALQRVVENPVPATDETIQLPAHELVARALFEISNQPDASVRGSMARANKARKMILDRLVGKRRAGTAPAVKVKAAITFVDLTQSEVEP